MYNVETARGTTNSGNKWIITNSYDAMLQEFGVPEEFKNLLGMLSPEFTPNRFHRAGTGTIKAQFISPVERIMGSRWYAEAMFYAMPMSPEERYRLTIRPTITGQKATYISSAETPNQLLRAGAVREFLGCIRVYSDTLEQGEEDDLW